MKGQATEKKPVVRSKQIRGQIDDGPVEELSARSPRFNAGKEPIYGEVVDIRRHQKDAQFFKVTTVGLPQSNPSRIFKFRTQD